MKRKLKLKQVWKDRLMMLLVAAMFIVLAITFIKLIPEV